MGFNEVFVFSPVSKEHDAISWSLTQAQVHKISIAVNRIYQPDRLRKSKQRKKAMEENAVSN